MTGLCETASDSPLHYCITQRSVCRVMGEISERHIGNHVECLLLVLRWSESELRRSTFRSYRDTLIFPGLGHRITQGVRYDGSQITPSGVM